jgi:cysteine synthase A
VKIEGVNPTVSYKDRVALAMVAGAEVIVEPSKGGRVTPDLWPRMRPRAKDLVGAGDHYWLDQFNNPYASIGRRSLHRAWV